MNIPCVIFDLDGTICDTRHRQHYLECQPKDWQSFFDACVDDPVVEYVRDLYRNLSGLVTKFICTGRPDSHERPTLHWLANAGYMNFQLLMRRTGDHRPDVEVKKEMLLRIRDQGYSPLFAVDDRPSVVTMWRTNGVPCFTVDQSSWEGKE